MIVINRFCRLAAATVASCLSLGIAHGQLPAGFSHDAIFSTEDFIHPDGNPMNDWNQLSYITSMKVMPDGRVFFGTADLRFIFWDPVVDVKEDGKGILPPSFMDLKGRKYGEAGVSSIVAAPDYLTTGHFYVSYIWEEFPIVDGLPVDRRIRVERLTADLGNKNQILSSPQETMIFDITDDNQMSTIHFGGGLMFGPDGMLYISLGDDGIVVNSQSLNSFRGKVLRMHPDGTAPADNPFFEEGNMGPRRRLSPRGGFFEVPGASLWCLFVLFVERKRNAFASQGEFSIGFSKSRKNSLPSIGRRMNMSSFSTRSRRILRMIAEGHGYEHIVASVRGATYHDIFAAAGEALELEETKKKEPTKTKAPSKTKKGKKSVDAIGTAYPRAFEPWTPEEEAKLLDFQKKGMAPAEISSMLKRNPRAIIARLEWLEKLAGNAARSSTRGRAARG